MPGLELCSLRVDLKKFSTANHFHDLQTDRILARSDFVTVTNLAHNDHPIPLYFYRHPDLNELGDGYAEARFRRAIDLAPESESRRTQLGVDQLQNAVRLDDPTSL